jgi:hypothetical protein
VGAQTVNTKTKVKEAIPARRAFSEVGVVIAVPPPNFPNILNIGGIAREGEPAFTIQSTLTLFGLAIRPGSCPEEPFDDVR